MRTRYVSSLRSPLVVPSGCPEIFPGMVNQQQLLKTEMYYYCAVASGTTRTFTDQDRLPEYDSSPILDPDQVSYINLYINGMLQPPIVYEVRRGVLLVKTSDIPQAGVIIMLQFVKIVMPAT